MIDAQSLTRRYAAVTAVNRVSFHIEPRVVAGLLGPAGAGKSTLLKMLSGYLEPTAGSLRVAGHDYARGCRGAQRVLGYLPQRPPRYPPLPVADYLDYCATCRGIPRNERSRAIREALLATDLLDQALTPIQRLPGDLRQWLGIAQAILGNPRLLLLDEPGTALDGAQAARLQTLVRQQARRCTVLLASEQLADLEAVCDRLLILHQGRLVVDASLAELRHSDTLSLRVSAASESLHHALTLLPDVAAVETRPQQQEYRLVLRAKTDPETAAGAIARCVADSGATLAALTPVQRDLAAVYREATADSPPPGRPPP